MTSTTRRTATWRPAAMLRPAVVHSSAAACRGRHRAPESGAVDQVGGEEALLRRGRHAEPEEDDSLDWLGFALRRD